MKPRGLYIGSGVPLGGVGCGTVEIRRDGRFYEWHIFNNGPWALRRVDRDQEFMDPEDFYFVVRVSDGEKVVVRFLQAARGYRQLEKRGGEACVGCSGDPYTMPWLRSVDEVEFNGEPPFAFLKYVDKDLPVDVTLEAFTPFIPGDSKNSSLPVAVLVFKVKNKREREVEVSILSGIKSPFSTIPARTITEPSIICRNDVKGVVITITGADVPEKHSMYNGSLSFGVVSSKLEVGFNLGTSLEASAFRRVWVEFRASGLLNDARSRGIFEEAVYSFVVGKRRLGALEEAEIIVILSWYFPNFYDVLENRLGHFYETMFSSSREVVEYVLENYSYLYTYTRKFHDIFYSTTIDYWMVDLIASQLTTLQKSTVYTKDGVFGVWEGYGCCGFNTTDVAFYGSVMLLQLFPDLEKKWVEYQARWTLNPELWPYYEIFALAIPENVVLLKDRIRRDPSIPTDLSKFREAVREVVKATGKDPTGRIMHFFAGSFKLPDTYDRPDMNPEYILIAIRDAIWLGDRELLSKLWSILKEAVESILRVHDPLNEGLLYHYTPAGYEAIAQSIAKYVPSIEPLTGYRSILSSIGSGYTFIPISVQTFDNLSFIGYASFTGIIWLAALRAMIKASSIVGDEEYGKHILGVYVRGRDNLLRYLWNGEYFDMWYDPVSGKRDQACLSSQLDGQMFTSLMLDMGYLFDREKVTSALKAIYKYNFKGEEGLINGSYPDKPRPSMIGDTPSPSGTGIVYTIGSQIDTPWTGIEFEVAAHMINEGLVSEALEILRAIHERYARYNEYWNHIECGGHYYRAMDSILVLISIEGLFYDGFKARLKFKPKMNKDSFRGLIVITGTWGSVEHTIEGNKQVFLLNLEKGFIDLEQIELEALGNSVKSITVSIDGVEVSASWTIRENTLEIKLARRVKLTKSLLLHVTYS